MLIIIFNSDEVNNWLHHSRNPWDYYWRHCLYGRERKEKLLTDIN